MQTLLAGRHRLALLALLLLWHPSTLLAAPPPPSPTAGALCALLPEAFENLDEESLRALLAPGEIQTLLPAPGRPGPETGEAAPKSPEQVFYMLSDWLGSLELLPVRDPGIEGSLSPQGRFLCEPPEISAGAATAVLHLREDLGAGHAPRARRLFLGLARLAEGWRVVEIRELP